MYHLVLNHLLAPNLPLMASPTTRPVDQPGLLHYRGEAGCPRRVRHDIPDRVVAARPSAPAAAVHRVAALGVHVLLTEGALGPLLVDGEATPVIQAQGEFLGLEVNPSLRVRRSTEPCPCIGLCEGSGPGHLPDLSLPVYPRDVEVGVPGIDEDTQGSLVETHQLLPGEGFPRPPHGLCQLDQHLLLNLHLDGLLLLPLFLALQLPFLRPALPLIPMSS